MGLAPDRWIQILKEASMTCLENILTCTLLAASLIIGGSFALAQAADPGAVVKAAYEKYKDLDEGANANYIPALAATTGAGFNSTGSDGASQISPACTHREPFRLGHVSESGRLLVILRPIGSAVLPVPENRVQVCIHHVIDFPNLRIFEIIAISADLAAANLERVRVTLVARLDANATALEQTFLFMLLHIFISGEFHCFFDLFFGARRTDKLKHPLHHAGRIGSHVFVTNN